MINIHISSQTLELIIDKRLYKIYQISSAKNGLGEKENSYCTPRGRHRISKKIGDGLAENSVLVGREFTGEIFNESLFEQYPDRDWILTRILWLEGLEEHNNNSKDRYIYIHGTPDSTELGKTGSKGCIRVKNKDMVEIFNLSHEGDEVNIIG